MRSSSLKMAIDHGIKSPQKYRDSLIHDWYIPDEYKQHLHQHFLAKELSLELRRNINGRDSGTLLVGKHIYEGIWINRPETVYKDEYALLSFRYCKYLECGYVLIKKYDAPENDTIPYLDYKR